MIQGSIDTQQKSQILNTDKRGGKGATLGAKLRIKAANGKNKALLNKKQTARSQRGSVDIKVFNTLQVDSKRPKLGLVNQKLDHKR